jgi:hypothetical protein
MQEAGCIDARGGVLHGCKRRGAARMQDAGCCTDARGGVLHGCKGWGAARMQEVGCCTDARGGGDARMQEAGCCTDARGGVMHGCKRWVLHGCKRWVATRMQEVGRGGGRGRRKSTVVESSSRELRNWNFASSGFLPLEMDGAQKFEDVGVRTYFCPFPHQKSPLFLAIKI